MNARRASHPPVTGQRGIALLTTILMMVLMSALLVGFTTAVMSDQANRTIDRDRARAFYGAQSGIEKQNADLAQLFINQVGPTDPQITALGNASNQPIIPNVTFVTTGSSPAYAVTPLGPATSGIIASGPYEGLMALKRQFRLDATARAVDGGEVHLLRTVETVAIPVFQFGIFSDVDLSFSAAANFDFGGRVHTNSNLFLAQANGSTLTLREKVTAVREIVRQRLSNRESIDASGSTGTVNMTRGNATGPFQNLLRTQGSVTDGLFPVTLNNNWPTISLSTYVSNIRNGRTGVRPLNLDLVTAAGANIDLVKRPPATELVTSPIFSERYFKKVSLRVLLSDNAIDITSLPSVSAGAPLSLDGDWTVAPPAAGYAPIVAARPPIARSRGPVPAVPAASTVNANVATGANQNITMNPSLPNFFKAAGGVANAITVTWGGGASVVTANCTGKTATTFTGCTRFAGAALPAPIGAVVSMVVPSPDAVNPAVTAPLSAAWTAAGLTMTFAGTFPTAPFTPNTFFVQGTNNLVTCTGYNTVPQLTGCNVATAIAAGAVLTTAARSDPGTGTIGGFLKVEVQTAPNVWQDVTLEFLRYGISGPNLGGESCGDPTPNAILRFQRLRDHAEPAAVVTCTYVGSTRSTDHWPNVLFDPREGVVRDADPGGNNVTLEGVMHYVALDVRNLSFWFNRAGAYAAGTGNLALREGNSPTGGYSVYFSDRRNNRDQANLETGEFGFEDVVNPASGTGAPSGALDAGEDMNGNGLLDNYGQFTSYNGVSGAVPPGAVAPLTTAARPWTFISGSEAKVNRPLHFRRALKLINGGSGNIVAPGLTVAAENPVYVQGDWNANAASPGANWNDAHVATSVAADAVTLLSGNWNDLNSFGTTADLSPYSIANRPRSNNSYYRLAIISGKGPVFPRPGGAGATYGTDGGAHSFLRFIEGDAAATNTIWYRGSMVTFYYHRQTPNPFKCCNGMVYGVPTRQYTFDIDFLNPVLLPPLTPVFRDINALGFTQETRPGR